MVAMIVTLLPIVQIPLDHSAVAVNQDTLEMDDISVQVYLAP